MGLNFPSGPTVGQLYPSPALAGAPVWAWDGSAWKTVGGQGLGQIYISDTAPTGAPPGSLWWESDSGILYIYYNDGDSSQWVMAMPVADATRYAVRYDTAQTLTAAQKDQGRRNLSIMSGGGISNLIASGSGGSITISADAVALVDASGNMFGATSVSLSVLTAGAGANGLDTGSIATGGYYYFVIYNPATDTKAGLLSLSATAPTMPSGYTYKRRIGWIFYSGGVTAFVQRNAQFAWVTPRQPVSGSQALAYFSLTNYVPPTVARVYFSMTSNNNTVAVNDNVGNPICNQILPGNGQIFTPGQFLYQGGTLQLQYSSSSAGGAVSITGWEDNI